MLGQNHNKNHIRLFVSVGVLLRLCGVLDLTALTRALLNCFVLGDQPCWPPQKARLRTRYHFRAKAQRVSETAELLACAPDSADKKSRLNFRQEGPTFFRVPTYKERDAPQHRSKVLLISKRMSKAKRATACAAAKPKVGPSFPQLNLDLLLAQAAAQVKSCDCLANCCTFGR